MHYPDESIAFRNLHRPLAYQVFDTLTCVDQGAIVDNKRLGAVLRLVQQKQNELEAEGKQMRSKKMFRGRAQERVLEELRAINPVLASPQSETMSPSLTCGIRVLVDEGEMNDHYTAWQILQAALRLDLNQASAKSPNKEKSLSDTCITNNFNCKRK